MTFRGISLTLVLLNATPMTNIEQRVASLEKSLRMYQYILSGVVLVALVISFSAFNNQQVPEKITAKAFEVVDGTGQVLVNISSYNGNGAITTYNKEGKYLVDVISNTSGFGNINIYDGKDKPTLQLYNVKGGGGAIAVRPVGNAHAGHINQRICTAHDRRTGMAGALL